MQTTKDEAVLTSALWQLREKAGGNTGSVASGEAKSGRSFLSFNVQLPWHLPGLGEEAHGALIIRPWPSPATVSLEANFENRQQHRNLTARTETPDKPKH